MKDFNFAPVLLMKQTRKISAKTVILIIVLASGMMAAIIYPYYRTYVLEQRLIAIQQVNKPGDGAADMDQKVLASKLEKQMSIIDDINKSKVPYSEAEARIMLLVPDGINIDSIAYNGVDVQLSGTAPDIGGIISFMKALDASGYYTDNTFEIIDRERHAGTYNFKISVHIVKKD